MPAHRDDGVDVFDHHRAFIDAGAAAGAGPEGLGLDHAAPIAGSQDRDAKALADPGRVGRALVALRRRARQCSDQILDQRLGIERLARRSGRADGFAAAALDAGIEADQPVPGEVADRPGAEPLCREIERRQIGNGMGRTETGGAGMDDEMQGPGDHMLQWTAGDLRGQSQKQQGGQDLARRHGTGSFGQKPHLGEGNGGGDQRKDQQQEGQHLETPAGEAPRLLRIAPAGDQQRSCDETGEACQQEQPRQNAAPAAPGHEQQQCEARQQPARGQRMHAAREALARDHLMHVMQIGPGQAGKPRQPIDLRRPAGGPAPDIEQERAGKDEGGQHQAEGEDSHGPP